MSLWIWLEGPFTEAQALTMTGRESTNASGAVHQLLFATTHWSVVLAAANEGTSEAAAALERLCGTYWYPLYAYVRRRGYNPEDAQDLAQEFFARLLQHEFFQLADPKRGRFRTFLLHALEHFVTNEWKRNQRLKRGGGAIFLFLNAEDGEARYGQEPATTMSPDRAYEKRWAITLLDKVLDSLRLEYTKAGKERLFNELAGLLWGKNASSETTSYASLSERLGMSEGAVRVAMHRLRGRYRELLLAEVAQTVASPEEVEQEVRYLLSVVSRTDS